jgi:pimeloyl-ACP methyl ester carboxylesterase
MKPTSVRSGYVMSGSTPLNYLEWGKRDAPVLVLIPPFKNPAYIWRSFAERLEDRYRCIAINLSGHSDSGPFRVRQYTPDVYQQDLMAFAEQLELDRATYVAYSVVATGAVITFSASHPERTRALVVVDAGNGHTPEQSAEARARMGNTPAAFPSWEAALAHRKAAADGRFAPPEVWEDRAPYEFRVLPDGSVTWKMDPLLREGWPGDDKVAFRNSGGLDWSVWERVRAPILILKANSWLLTPEICERLVKYGKGSRWVQVPSTSHNIHDENLDGMIEALEPFLKEVHRA